MQDMLDGYFIESINTNTLNSLLEADSKVHCRKREKRCMLSDTMYTGYFYPS